MRSARPATASEPLPLTPTIEVYSTTNHNYLKNTIIMIPPAVQRGMAARGGDDAIKTQDGTWLILREQAVVGRMVPRRA